MTKSELVLLLDDEGIRRDAYEIDSAWENECYVLRSGNRRWSVYYSERGLETGKREFDSEHDACVYLLGLLRNDLTTRREIS